MIKNKLLSVLLFGSSLALTGCGSGSGSGSGNSSSSGNPVSNLNNAQANIQQVQSELSQVISELEDAKRLEEASKKGVDLLQSQLARGEVTTEQLEVAQEYYVDKSNKVKELEQRRVELANRQRILSEQRDSAAAEVKLDDTLDNIVPDILSGKFLEEQENTFINAVKTQPAEKLVAPINKAIADFKLAFSNGEKIKAALPKLLSSPITDKYLLPLAAWAMYKPVQEYMSSNNPDDTFYHDIDTPYFSFGGGIQRSMQDTRKISLSTLERNLLKGTTKGLTTLGENNSQIRSLLVKKIDDFYNQKNDNTMSVLQFDSSNPMVLFNSFLSALIEAKPKVIEAVSQWDESFFEGLPQLLQHIPEIGEEGASTLKGFIAEMAGVGAAQPMSAEMPASSSGGLTYRQARSGNGGVDVHQFTVDGQPVDLTIAFGIPVHVQLTGDLNTASRTGDLAGSVTFNLNGTMFGISQALGNMSDRHSETSLVVSQSVNNFFAEVQFGSVGMRESVLSGWEGQRYQATVGYDAAYVSPFVQLEYRPLSNGISTLDATGVYVGLETDALRMQLPEATLTSRLLAKVGYESTAEKLLGEYALRPNTGAAAFVEWTGGLSLSNGLEVATGLTLGSNNAGVKLNVSFEK